MDGLGSMWASRVAALRCAVVLVVAIAAMPGSGRAAVGQTAPSGSGSAAPVKKNQAGTVKAISGNQITLGGDSGQEFLVTVPTGTRLVQVAPGSSNLSSAQAIELSAIAVGDKILVTGAPGGESAAATFTAARVVLMKSGAIAQKHAAEAGDWQRRGSGGIVTAVDPASETFTVANGSRTAKVTTTPATIYRRYAGDSVKFEDAKLGKAADIRVGDQVRVRGSRTGDPAAGGVAVAADEIVSGAFQNLAGTLTSVDAAAGLIVVKDVVSKKMVTVQVSANSDVRRLPPEDAARLAARAKGGAGANSGWGANSGPAGARAGAGAGSGGVAASGGPGGRPGGGGADLSQLLPTFPVQALADLKPGDAVMIVASESAAGGTVTVVTMLSGVEAILAATPAGQPAATLSPWGLSPAPGEGGL